MSESKKSICRVVHNKNYTVVHNFICTDNRLSYKAKGIWLYAFSRPDDWDFYESDIVNNCNEKKDSIKSGLKELEEAGYLVKERRKNEKNQFVGWSYTFYEVPREIKEKFPKAEKPVVGKSQTREKPPLLSTDVLPSTEEQQQSDISPDGSAAAFDLLLEKTGLKAADKKSIISYMKKNKLKEEDLAQAIQFVMRPEFVIKESLVKALMWALKEKPELPKPVDKSKNKALADTAEYFFESKTWKCEALSEKVIFQSKTPNNTSCILIEYRDPDFERKLKEMLKTLGFKKLENRGCL